MKKNILLSGLLLLLISLNAHSQRNIKASDIMRDLKKGKDISYKNATIEGVLDFTSMEEELPKLPRKRRWFNNGGSNTIKRDLSSKITFENCVFTDPVYAYIHDEDSGYTFVANFEDNLSFKNCQFKDDALFKYSTFSDKADFSNSHFERENSFKYAVFKRGVDFSEATFKEEGMFKYTSFRNGVSFNKSVFKDELNIKYAKVSGKFDIKNMLVEEYIDSKYTRINREKFRYSRN